jgi:transcriptional regulator with PAS, ATPase and Fis domain
VSRIHPRLGIRQREPIIVSASQAMREVCATAARVAAGDSKVFISGESGVGKDLIAQYIHARSRRVARPYIAVNCAAFSETLLETELFGHARGSFTGAYRDRPGCLEQAHRGTIFLDEVGEMSLGMQADLLRFLENGEVQRVGDAGPRRHVDVRVIAATNRDLNERVTSGHFRKDLLYRIQVVQLHVPPLRERREDIRPLIEHAIARTRRPITIQPDALKALERYGWPGNVRELQNVIEQLAWTAASNEVTFRDLPEFIRTTQTGGVLPRRERRRQAADDLYAALVGQQYTFWDHIHGLFLRRDMTRHDLRQLMSRGLATTRGNYRSLLKLFGMPETDYKRFMNFLAAHECVVDFRPFRVDSVAARLPATAAAPLRFDEARGIDRRASTRRAAPTA